MIIRYLDPWLKPRLLRNYDAVVVAVGSRWETLLRGRVQARIQFDPERRS